MQESKALKTKFIDRKKLQ